MEEQDRQAKGRGQVSHLEENLWRRTSGGTSNFFSKENTNSFLSHDSLLDLGSDELRDVVHARARRRINRGLKRKPMGLIKKLRKAKQEAKPNEKPDLVKTHLRDMIVVPEMIGSVIGIYSGKEFNQVEIKPEMVGHYLGEFSIT